MGRRKLRPRGCRRQGFLSVAPFLASNTIEKLATGSDLFPHLHNGLRLGKEEIVGVAEWKKDKQAGWDDPADKSFEEG
ncbi:hypothetical protein CPB83DRAFT_843795, partial [Crepidotus variabilis]